MTHPGGKEELIEIVKFAYLFGDPRFFLIRRGSCVGHYLEKGD